jgi:hypothetical protein
MRKHERVSVARGSEVADVALKLAGDTAKKAHSKKRWRFKRLQAESFRWKNFRRESRRSYRIAAALT